jgi:ABC-type multidrug transport system ATPase subunit
MMMSETLIAVEGLHVSFPRGGAVWRLLGRRLPSHVVLRGVDLRVAAGEFCALLGENGAGKTTVLKTIATLLLPTAGRVTVCGFDVVRQERQVRAVIGYVLADERSFHWRLSARENLTFFATLNGIRPAEGRARINFLLERLDLRHAADRPFGEFSTGMKQRLAVARALLARPRVLLMDEPTRSVDGTHAAAVWQLVREEVEAVNGCVLLVTHQVQEALSLCRRLTLLKDGRIAVDTSAREVEALTRDLDGFTVTVRGLAAHDLEMLRRYPGIRDLRVASCVANEQVLEVWTCNGDLSLAGFIGEVTGLGATVTALHRAIPLQGLLERLGTSHREQVAV